MSFATTVYESSKKSIEGLEPSNVWNYFLTLSQIPRPSKKEEKVVQYLRNYAKENNFNIIVDKLGNCVVQVPATQGYENAPVVAIQGHIDMVCEKNKETIHDFENDPISLIRTDDGKWITADNTTLGADNGIGVCCGLAVATDPTVIHGPLELLFTVDEEQGMSGVKALTPDLLKAKYLLNLDTEEADCFYVACAGGVDTVGSFLIEEEDLLKENYTPISLMVSGLKGGHSGLEINTGKANAIKLIGRLLEKIMNCSELNNFKVFKIEGGDKPNAIPRECIVNAYLKTEKLTIIEQLVEEFDCLMKQEFHVGDANVKIVVKKENYDNNDEKVVKVFTTQFLEKIKQTILAIPSGIIQLSQVIDGLTETSTSLSIIQIKEDKQLTIVTSQRSSIDSAKDYISSSVASVFKLAGANNIMHKGSYPGWKLDLNSELFLTCKKVFYDLYQREPKAKAIHAGLETGLLGAVFPGLDMISFGPTIVGIHAPGEKVLIEDVVQSYELTKAVLLEIAKKRN
ncbi:hypothetical protein ABK040_013303 [Willaertia magna]